TAVSSPSKLQIHLRLPAVAFFDEPDLTELTQAPKGAANTSRGDGDWLGFVDELDEHPGCKEALVLLQRLPNDLHRALLPVPFPVPFEGVCRHPRWGGLAWFGLGRKVVGGGCRPE